MAPTLTTYLIICPLVFLSGLVDAIGGGGGLISLPAYLMAGLPAHLALGCNKFSSSIGTFVSTARYCKNKCYNLKLAVPGIIAALAGAQVGARVSLLVEDGVFRIVLLILLPIIALYVLLHQDHDHGDLKPVSQKKQMILVTVGSLLLGVYDGFYGPGTGTFLLLVYHGLCRMDLMPAAGNKGLVNLASNISSLVVFMMNGVVLLPLSAVAAVFSILGHYLGAGLAMKNGRRLVRIVILAVLALLFVKVLTESLQV